MPLRSTMDRCRICFKTFPYVELVPTERTLDVTERPFYICMSCVATCPSCGKFEGPSEIKLRGQCRRCRREKTRAELASLIADVRRELSYDALDAPYSGVAPDLWERARTFLRGAYTACCDIDARCIESFVATVDSPSQPVADLRALVASFNLPSAMENRTSERAVIGNEEEFERTEYRIECIKRIVVYAGDDLGAVYETLSTIDPGAARIFEAGEANVADDLSSDTSSECDPHSCAVGGCDRSAYTAISNPYMEPCEYLCCFHDELYEKRNRHRFWEYDDWKERPCSVAGCKQDVICIQNGKDLCIHHCRVPEPYIDDVYGGPE
jgi:hypothetical protein